MLCYRSKRSFFFDADSLYRDKNTEIWKGCFRCDISEKTYTGKNVSSEEKGKVIYSRSELTKRKFKAGFKQQKKHLQRIESTHLQQIPEA